MKKYITPEIDCVFFDITTPTNARTLEEWIALDEATDNIDNITSAVAVDDTTWSTQEEWQLVD